MPQFADHTFMLLLLIPFAMVRMARINVYKNTYLSKMTWTELVLFAGFLMIGGYLFERSMEHFPGFQPSAQAEVVLQAPTPLALSSQD